MVATESPTRVMSTLPLGRGAALKALPLLAGWVEELPVDWVVGEGEGATEAGGGLVVVAGGLGGGCCGHLGAA